MANQQMQSARQGRESKDKSVDRDVTPQSQFATSYQRPLAFASANGDANGHSSRSSWELVQLQRTIGNKAVCQLLGSSAGGAGEQPLNDYEADKFIHQVRNTSSAPAAHGHRGSITSQIGPVADDEVSTAPTAEKKQETQSTGTRSSWGSAAGNSAPRAVSWAAINKMSESEEGSETSGPPKASSLKTIQTHAGDKTTHGWTYFPKGFKAPNFTFESFNISTFGILPLLKAAPAWYSRPKLKQKANEGKGDSFYPTAGKHKTQLKEAGKTVYWNFSPSISLRIDTAEQEHCDDHAEAYKISLKEAEDVLTTHVIGKMFGPKPTKAAAETMVLDTIKAKLTHPQLGNDKTKWKGKYDMLFRKTGDRDAKGWHFLPPDNRKVVGGHIEYDIVKGTSKIGIVQSKDVIKY
jgi:hypothetical protein